MKEALTSFDIRALLREFSAIRGAYLNQVYQRDSSFILRFNLPRAGKKELFLEPGKWLFLGEDFEKPQEPPPLAQNLRKVLVNAVLQDVQQRGFDRILLMRFVKESEYTLVLEMFGRGNLILLKGDEILLAMRSERWRTREVRRGEDYRFPPEIADPTALEFDGFRNALRGHGGPVVKALASGLSLGGLYAEEACRRADVLKNERVGDLGDDEIERLFERLAELVAQLDSPAPVMIIEESPVDVVPFPLQIYEGHETKSFRSMSEALQVYVDSLQAEVPIDEAKARVERRIARQEGALKDIQGEIERAGAAAEYLYANYQEVDKLLRLAQERELPEGVDLERGVLRLDADGLSVELDQNLGVDENARIFYEKKKALLERRERVERALEDSQHELAKVGKAARKRAAKPSYKPSKRFWFDSYRWSLTSGGFLILGGRDARSNERLVRKHLEPGDRYIHADMPGAPSVILKSGSDAEERDLKEACRFALVFSKAWHTGLGSGSAYSVTPEQVSKTAESGEYLKTGSFVIRGKRSYHHNITLTLGVGEVLHEGARRVISADPDAIEELSGKYIILKPAGPLERRSLVRQLFESFEVPPEEVERILPAGTFSVGKVKGLKLKE